MLENDLTIARIQKPWRLVIYLIKTSSICFLSLLDFLHLRFLNDLSVTYICFDCLLFFCWIPVSFRLIPNPLYKRYISFIVCSKAYLSISFIIPGEKGKNKKNPILLSQSNSDMISVRNFLNSFQSGINTFLFLYHHSLNLWILRGMTLWNET